VLASDGKERIRELQAKIGELTMENSFLESALGKFPALCPATSRFTHLGDTQIYALTTVRYQKRQRTADQVAAGMHERRDIAPSISAASCLNRVAHTGNPVESSPRIEKLV
jgi:hypothetical protein